MLKFTGGICFLITFYNVGIDAQHVQGNCAVGIDCDHCPLNRVKWMRNSLAGYDRDFKVCCSNCNRHFFSYNVLWSSYCTCMNIPDIDFSNFNFGNRNNFFSTNNAFSSSNTDGFSNQDVSGTSVRGNCWHGSNCTSCTSATYSNGIRFCCPHCEGYGISVSSINNRHTCRCQRPSQRPGVTGNCLMNEACDGCNSVNYMNNVRFCCPGCRGSNSITSNGFSTECHCY